MTKSLGTILAIVGIVIVISTTLLVWSAHQPPPQRPNVSILFVGYTNDLAGGQLATFLITNGSSASIRRLSHYRIQIPMAHRWTNISGGWSRNGSSILTAGASETVSVPRGTNAEWRLAFSVEPEVGMMHDLMNSLRDMTRAAGLRAPYRRAYAFQSEWIKE